MENEDSLITLPSTPESDAAEEVAFAEAFNAGRGIEAEPQSLAAEPPTTVPDADSASVGKGANPEPSPSEVVSKPVGNEEPVVQQDKPNLIAGLTEEQLTAALGRSSTLQGTVDKMAGRIGQLMQQVEALRKTPPTTQAAQVALDLKLEKLSVAFPELATLLREDLQGLQTANASAPPVAAAPPAGITQEQLDAMFAERLGNTEASIKEQVEMRVLSVIHPDWLDIIKTPQFAVYRDNVLPEGVGKQLMESEDSSFISKKLTEFKEWQAAQAAPTPVPVVQLAKKSQSRLSNAVLPVSAGVPPNVGPVTEEDAFEAAFKKERARSSY